MVVLLLLFRLVSGFGGNGGVFGYCLVWFCSGNKVVVGWLICGLGVGFVFIFFFIGVGGGGNFLVIGISGMVLGFKGRILGW